jgi:hypothetical protein
MHPVLIQIGPLVIRWYGVISALACFVGLWIAVRADKLIYWGNISAAQSIGIIGIIQGFSLMLAFKLFNAKRSSYGKGKCAEGNFGCFRKGGGHCDQVACTRRPSCLLTKPLDVFIRQLLNKQVKFFRRPMQIAECKLKSAK